jgi:hypothetical protein
VMDADGGTEFGYALRRRLAREHLDDPEADVRDPVAMFDAYRRSAAALDAWHEAQSTVDRPAGRLRAYRPPRLAPLQRRVAGVMYRYLCDPDGRPTRLRRDRTF